MSAPSAHAERETLAALAAVPAVHAFITNRAGGWLTARAHVNAAGAAPMLEIGADRVDGTLGSVWVDLRDPAAREAVRGYATAILAAVDAVEGGWPSTLLPPCEPGNHAGPLVPVGVQMQCSNCRTVIPTRDVETVIEERLATRRLAPREG